MSQLIFAIYAVSENGVIGKNNQLPWHLPNDLKHFKAKTQGKPILMGRKSFESLGKALPKRRNIVISRNPSFTAPGIEVAHSLEEAIQLCHAEPEICITGGALIYRESIEKGFVSRIYETLIHAEVDGDTFFHLSNEDEWTITEVDARQADERHAFAYTFRTLEKISHPD
ncbi:MAG: dihydrofolate reductase [Bacteroidota bacterium]